MAADAVFNRLPVEILLRVALRIPDLSSSYALDKVSKKFALMFNEYGTHILERVVDTAGLGAPPHQVREIIRLIVYVRTTCLSNHPPKNPAILDVFVSQLFGKLPVPPPTPPSERTHRLSFFARFQPPQPSLTSSLPSASLRSCAAVWHSVHLTPSTGLDPSLAGSWAPSLSTSPVRGTRTHRTAPDRRHGWRGSGYCAHFGRCSCT